MFKYVFRNSKSDHEWRSQNLEVHLSSVGKFVHSHFLTPASSWPSGFLTDQALGFARSAGVTREV